MDTREMHRTFLQEVRAQIADLTSKLDDLRIVEAFHADRAGEEHSEPEVPDLGVEVATSPYAGMTKHDAAAAVLKERGGPMKIVKIVEHLQSRGYEVNADKRSLFNSLYTAMKRRDDMFEKLPQAEWALKGTVKRSLSPREWARKSPQTEAETEPAETDTGDGFGR